jgi:hypothetical protein
MEKRRYSLAAVRHGYVCRPAGQLGTVGWHPYPWTAVFGKTPSEALDRFKQAHPESRDEQNLHLPL